MKELYADSIQGLNCMAVAIMDDVYFIGTGPDTCTAVNRFAASLISRGTGLKLNLPKSLCLIPRGDRNATNLCKKLKIPTTTISLPALGGIISRNKKVISKWISTNVKSHTPYFNLLLDPSLPSQHAYAILRNCVLPKLNYFSRIFPPDVLASAAKSFDVLVRETFCAKHLLPILNSEARDQLSWPTVLGGFGLCSIQQVSPFSYYSALSQYFHRISPIIPSPDSTSSVSPVPFVKSIRKCHRLLLDLKAPLPSRFPLHADQFFTDSTLNPATAGFQASLLKVFYKHHVNATIDKVPLLLFGCPLLLSHLPISSPMPYGTLVCACA